MQYGLRYRIRKPDRSIVEGEYFQTTGDDENHPTFTLDDGSRLGVHISNVLAPVDGDCENCEDTHHIYVQAYGKCGCACHDPLVPEENTGFT